MLANPRTFRCPNCKEMINDSMAQAITALHKKSADVVAAASPTDVRQGYALP